MWYTIMKPGMTVIDFSRYIAIHFKDGAWAIKGAGHVWQLPKILEQNLLGNEQLRAVDSIKHCEKRPPSEVT